LTFREFSESIGKCKYTKCSHTKEEGCDILARVKAGEIPKSRHQSYVSLYEVLKNKPKWKK
jgi:ribosome biogenesis GTPase